MSGKVIVFFAVILSEHRREKCWILTIILSEYCKHFESLNLYLETHQKLSSLALVPKILLHIDGMEGEYKLCSNIRLG